LGSWRLGSLLLPNFKRLAHPLPTRARSSNDIKLVVDRQLLRKMLPETLCQPQRQSLSTSETGFNKHRDHPAGFQPAFCCRRFPHTDQQQQPQREMHAPAAQVCVCGAFQGSSHTSTFCRSQWVATVSPAAGLHHRRTRHAPLHLSYCMEQHPAKNISVCGHESAAGAGRHVWGLLGGACEARTRSRQGKNTIKSGKMAERHSMLLCRPVGVTMASLTSSSFTQALSSAKLVSIVSRPHSRRLMLFLSPYGVINATCGSTISLRD
jgi:hypothetical protein